MLKKIALFAMVSVFMYSCGTILKPYQVNKPHSSKLDVTVVVLDALGLLLFIIPGVVSYTVDYLNGTLYLPNGRVSLNDKSDYGIQKALAANGYNVSVQQIQAARLEQSIQ